jgi:hypothetical protein
MCVEFAASFLLMIGSSHARRFGRDQPRIALLGSAATHEHLNTSPCECAARDLIFSSFNPWITLERNRSLITCPYAGRGSLCMGMRFRFTF